MSGSADGPAVSPSQAGNEFGNADSMAAVAAAIAHETPAAHRPDTAQNSYRGSVYSGSVSSQQNHENHEDKTSKKPLPARWPRFSP